MSDGRTDHATAPDEALASPLFFDEATNIVDAGGGVGVVDPALFKGPTLDGEVSDGSEITEDSETTEDSLPRSVGDGRSGGEGADDEPTEKSSHPFLWDGSSEVPKGVVAVVFKGFTGCTALTSINIPSGVTDIGNAAFSRCTSLSSIDIPSGLTNIGNRAFRGCTALTSIDIPSGVTTIGHNAFYGCRSLASIDIPSGVTEISYLAFYECTSLTSIVIPSGVTTIGDGAFYGCTSLASIDIPSGVTEIGAEAFWGCDSLKSINCPSTVTNIGSRAFTFEAMLAVEENKSVELNNVWADTTSKEVLEFINEEPKEAVTLASDGKLPRMDDPRVSEAVFKEALQSDLAVAIKLASTRFHLSETPKSERNGREVRARLPKGGFFVTDSAGGGNNWNILNSLLERHTKRNTTSVPSHVLHLDMEQLCGASPSRTALSVMRGLPSQETQKKPSRAILEQLIETDKAEFFTSIAVRAAVQLKWQTFGRRHFLIDTIFYVISLALMATVSFTTTNWNAVPETPESIMILFATSILCVHGVGEIFALIRQPVAYLRDVWNIIDIIRLVLILTFCALHFQGSVNARDVLAYELLFHYIGLFHYLRPWERIGRPILMVIQVLRDIKVFAVVLVVIMWGTTNALFSYHKETDSSLSGDSSIAYAFLTTCNQLLFSSFEDEATFVNSENPLLPQFLLLFSNFLVSIILLNLLIAILSDSYERIQDRSLMEQTLAKAKIIQELEVFSFARVVGPVLRLTVFFVLYLPFLVLAKFLLYMDMDRFRRAVILDNGYWLLCEFAGVPYKSMADTDEFRELCLWFNANFFLGHGAFEMGWWPEKAIVVVPKDADQNEAPEDEWQGMLHNIKEHTQNQNNEVKADVTALQIAVENQVGTVSAKVDKLEENVGKLEEKADKLEEKVDKLDKKVDKLEEKVDKLDEKADKLEEKVDKLDEKVDKILELLLQGRASGLISPE